MPRAVLFAALLAVLAVRLSDAAASCMLAYSTLEPGSDRPGFTYVMPVTLENGTAPGTPFTTNYNATYVGFANATTLVQYGNLGPAAMQPRSGSLYNPYTQTAGDSFDLDCADDNYYSTSVPAPMLGSVYVTGITSGQLFWVNGHPGTPTSVMESVVLSYLPGQDNPHPFQADAIYPYSNASYLLIDGSDGLCYFVVDESGHPGVDSSYVVTYDSNMNLVSNVSVTGHLPMAFYTFTRAYVLDQTTGQTQFLSGAHGKTVIQEASTLRSNTKLTQVYSNEGMTLLDGFNDGSQWYLVFLDERGQDEREFWIATLSNDMNDFTQYGPYTAPSNVLETFFPGCLSCMANDA